MKDAEAPPSSPGLEHLPGTRVPTRAFTIDAAEDARFCVIVGDEPAGDGTAHPMWGYLLSRRALVLDLHELLALADFRVEDGPLLGSFDLTLFSTLTVGSTYTTEIMIDAITRKQGRRTGVFDLMDLSHRYTNDEGVAVGRYVQQYVLPRREL